MKIRLAHVRVNVKNLNAAIDWYTTILGFKVAATWPPENPNYAHFELEYGATFAIMEDVNYPSYGRFNFNITDVDSLWLELKDKVHIVEELIKKGTVHRRHNGQSLSFFLE